MFGMEIVELAIGLAFVYLLLGLICSALNEVVLTMLRFRARDLNDFLNRLMTDDALAKALCQSGSAPSRDEWARNRAAVATRFNKHPLISSLGTTPAGGVRLFCGALRGVRRCVSHRLDVTPAENNPSLTYRPSYIPPNLFSTALVECLAETAQGLGKPNAAAKRARPVPRVMDSTESVRQTLLLLPAESSLRQALLARLNTAEDDLKKFHENVQDWFDSMMQRLSGRFRRRAQVFAFLIAAIITLALNVDSIALIKHLSSESGLRESLVAAAEQCLKDNPDLVLVPNNLGAEQAKQQDSPPTPASTADFANLDVQMKEWGTQLRLLGLPIGWEDAEAYDCGGWFMRLSGWLMTTIAVSLGAPFWFDLLNKFMSFRGAISIPEKQEVKKG